MGKEYSAPELYVDDYAPDTMIASAGEPEQEPPGHSHGHGAGPKNGNAAHNQNCWGLNAYPGAIEGNKVCL